MPNFYVYILQCSDYSYYIGNTGNLTLRMYQHDIGEASSYTCNRRPVTLVWHKQFETRDEAFIVERKIKGWSRAKKNALILDDWKRIQELAFNHK